MTALIISGQYQNYVPLEQQENIPFQYIERWKIGDKEICLLRKKDELFYEILDTLTNKATQGLINIEKHRIEDAINYLVNCQPQISEMGEVGFSPRTPCPHVLRWIINDKVICLLRKDDQLHYEILSHCPGKNKEGLIPLNGHRIDEVVSSLSQCQLKISKTDDVSFFPKELVHYEWKFRNKEVQLLQKGHQLIWQLFDKGTKIISQIPFQTSFDQSPLTKRSDTHQEQQDNRLKKRADRALKLSLKALKDCEIEKLEVKPSSQSTHQLAAVYPKKTSRQSELDPKVTIDCDRWAITLINSGGARKKGACSIKKEFLPDLSLGVDMLP